MDDTQSDSDRRLVREASAGDQDAFEDLVRRHQSAIVGFIRVLASRQEDAEDLAQEVFVRAWKGLRGFRGDSTFRTWLHRIAINVVRSAHARDAGVMRIFRRTVRSPEPASPQQPVDARLARRQVVERALAALPDDLRIAVTLRDLQGLDYQEIAVMLDVPVGTVESRIFRARQRLKPLLAGLV